MTKRGSQDPLTPAALHVLLSLAEGPLHGYGIKQDVAARTDGSVDLGPGTLYEAIHRLVSSGWIEDAGRDGRRKNYRLTARGREGLGRELARLDGLVRYARSKSLIEDPR